MVKAVCGCLNVKIHIKGDLAIASQYPSDNLGLTESQDLFFQQAPKQITLDLPGVGIEYGFLVQSRNVGAWNVFHCLCCKMDTHAVPQCSNPFLVNSTLMTDPSQISKLQQSERFSPVYQIVMPWVGGGGPSSPRNYPERGTQGDQAVAAIQQKMTNFLKKEEAKVEENIQRYTEQQQAALLAIETRVRQDRNTLLMLISQKEGSLDKKMQNLNIKSEVTPPTTPTTKISSFSFTSPTKELPNPPIRRGIPKLDDDIFDFDDYSDHNASGSDPFDASEFDEDSTHSSSVSIPRRPTLTSDEDSALAKSLPMRVPMSNYRTQDIDIDDRTPVNPEEMAASIKALARSVHGSDSFWDLPRPRLNTLH